MQYLLDRAEITERLADLALGLDLLDPDRYRRCFADLLEVRNPHFAAKPWAEPIPGDRWADSVLARQAGFAVRVHVLSNPSIAIAGDEADVVLTQQATFGTGPDDAWYRVAGPLRLHLVRLPGWRITRLHFEVRSVEGDRALHALVWGSDREIGGSGGGG
jgi:hypothetical protein